MIKLIGKVLYMYESVFTFENPGYDSPRALQKALKEDPKHCLGTPLAVSNDGLE